MQFMNKKKIAAMLVVGTVAVAGAGSALAADANTVTTDMRPAFGQKSDSAPNKPGDGPKTGNGDRAKRAGGFFDCLVTDGTITEEQKDTIQKAIEEARVSDKSLSDVLSELVSNRSITQDQMNSIVTIMRESKGPHGGGFLNKLVTDSTITQEQKDTIQEAMQDARGSDKTLSDVLSALVTNSTITQDQMNSILTIMPESKGPHGGGFLNKLVTDSTITQEQKDAIREAMQDARGSDKTLSDVLSALVTNSTFTQDQMNSILTTMQEGRGPHSGGYLNKLVQR